MGSNQGMRGGALMNGAQFSSCGMKEASVLKGTLKEIYFPLTCLSDAVSSNAVWENRALAGASEPRSDFGVDEILCLLASSSGRVPQKVTGHARSHLEGPSSRVSTHPLLYSW